MAADYSAQAASIYSPQLAADQQTLQGEQATANAGFAGETTTAQQAYTDALKTAQQTEQTGEANDNFTAATHGLTNSGLAANAVRLTYGKFQDNATSIGQTRAAKLADIAARQQASDQNYTDKAGALTSKYQGDEANYVATQQNADAKAAQTEATYQAHQQETYAHEAATKAPTAAETKQATLGSLQSDVGTLMQGISARPDGYTESTIIPKLQTLYPELTPAEIKQQVYAIRKSNYGS